jgi:translation initiation factor 2A
VLCAVKTEEGQPGHKNLKVWDSATGAELAGWAQKSLDGWYVHLCPI